MLENLVLQQRGGVVQHNHVRLTAAHVAHLVHQAQPSLETGFAVLLGEEHGHVHVALRAGLSRGAGAEQVGRHHVRLRGEVAPQGFDQFLAFEGSLWLPWSALQIFVFSRLHERTFSHLPLLIPFTVRTCAVVWGCIWDEKVAGGTPPTPPAGGTPCTSGIRST